MKSFRRNTKNSPSSGAPSAAEKALTTTAQTAASVVDGVGAAANHIKEGVTTAAVQLQQGVASAATSLNEIVTTQIATTTNHAPDTLLSYFEYKFDKQDILSDKLIEATRALRHELTVRKDPQYNDDAIGIWKPNDEIVDSTLATFAEAQDLMCAQLFSAHKNMQFNLSDKELFDNYINLDKYINDIYQSAKTETKAVYQAGLKTSDINQNYKAFHLQMEDLYSQIGYGPMAVLNSLINLITEQKKLLEISRTILNGQIGSIENNMNELSEFISAIEQAMRDELNDKNPDISLYEDQIATYKNQLNQLAQTNTILKKIITEKTSENTDAMSHCISAEEYFYIHDHPRTDFIPEQAAINKHVDSIAHAMVTIQPGMAAIREGVEKMEDKIASTLVGAAVTSMTPYLSEMAGSLQKESPSKQSKTFKLASYLTLIAAFYDRVTLLSSDGVLTYRGKEPCISNLLKEAAFRNDMPAFIAASTAFNAAMKPITEITEAYLLQLVDEVNHQINGVDENTPGFMRKPEQELAKSIIENLKCFDIISKAYALYVENDEVMQTLSSFNVSGENIRTADQVVVKLFDILTKSITYYIDVSKLNETKGDLENSVKGYTTLQKACEIHQFMYRRSALDIVDSANNIKNRYIQKLKLIDDMTAFAVIQRIMEYSEHFYQYVARPLGINWIVKEQLMLELIEIFIRNPSYLMRSKAIKDEHHREMYNIIKKLISGPIAELYTHIFPVQAAEAIAEQSLTLLKYQNEMNIDENNLQHVYLKALELILINNPNIHELTFEPGLTIHELISMCILASDQVHTFKSDKYYALTDHKLNCLMNSLPGIQLSSSESAITETHTQTTITRIRPEAREKAIATIEVQPLDEPNDNNNNNSSIIAHTVVSQQGKISTIQSLKNKAHTISEKAKVQGDKLRDKAAQTLAYLDNLMFNDNPNNNANIEQSPEINQAPESIEDELKRYHSMADKTVQDLFGSEEDRKIYMLLRKHHMNPIDAYHDAEFHGTFEAFNGAAIRILSLSPSTLFIKRMANLSLGQKNIASAAAWCKHLKDTDPASYTMIVYQLFTEHKEALVNRSLYGQTIEDLISQVKISPFNLMPHQYIKIITAALEIREFTNQALLDLVDAYLQSRECLYDYQALDSLNAHYDCLLASVSKIHSSNDGSCDKLFNLILRSNVYGTITTRQHLTQLFSQSKEKFTDQQISSTLDKVDALNLKIAEHVKLFFNKNQMLPIDIKGLNSIDRNKMELHHDNHMLVLMNNTFKGISQTPLHDHDNSVQASMNSAFTYGLIQHFMNFKDCVNFSEHASNYIRHLVKLKISEEELMGIISAVSQLTLANMRNLENTDELVLFIEMIAEQFPVPSAPLLSKINDFKNKIIERKLIKVMDAILFHFNATLLPENEVSQLRKNIVSMMNEQDSKSLSKSLANITKTYRSLLGTESLDFKTITAIKQEIEFIITFCDKVSGMNPQTYLDNHHVMVIQSSRINMPLLSNEGNSRLATLIESLPSQPKTNEIVTLKCKMQSMYSKIMELLVLKSIPNLKTPQEYQILKTLLESCQKRKLKASSAIASAYESAGIQSVFTLHYRAAGETGIQKLLKAINPEMLEHIDKYTLAVLLRCVTSKISKPNVTHLKYIM